MDPALLSSGRHHPGTSDSLTIQSPVPCIMQSELTTLYCGTRAEKNARLVKFRLALLAVPGRALKTV